MLRILCFVVMVAACGSAPKYRVNLVNSTTRPIERVFVFPMGSAEHGQSRGGIAPGGNMEMQLEAGRHDVLVESQEVRVSPTERERRSATSTLELRKAVEVIFYDSNTAEPKRSEGQVLVPFRVDDIPAPGDAPASDAPASDDPSVAPSDPLDPKE